MRMERIWAMPNKWTFAIKPIDRLLREEMGKGVWVDPFAGVKSPATITNDLNPEHDGQRAGRGAVQFPDGYHREKPLWCFDDARRFS